MFPRHIKAKIVTRIRPVARILFGKLNNDYTDIMRKAEWKKVFEYCETLNAPEIKSIQDVKDKFQRWKQSLAQKIERKKKTGAPRGEDYDESELVITAIINENPCLQKSEVYTFHILI